jgi:Protein of unknown function with PCYCGC motif
MVDNGLRASRSRPGITRYRWPALLAVIALSVAVAFLWRGESPPTAPAISSPPAPGSTAARLETRPTLDPARFVGKAAAAHRVAREIPDLLDRLYCYCGCDKQQGHKSLLSCFTDGHAAT